MGWKQVESESPNDVKYIGICDYCGCEGADIWRASKSAGGPLRTYSGNHKDPFDCIRYLRKLIDQ